MNNQITKFIFTTVFSLLITLTVFGQSGNCHTDAYSGWDGNCYYFSTYSSCRGGLACISESGWCYDGNGGYIEYSFNACNN
jgi:hypothetical protein